MRVVLVLYLFVYSILWWGYFGYFIFLYILSLVNPSKVKDQEIKDFPSISLLVPCYNEEKFIEKKIENLSKLTYPKGKLRIIFLDGRSTDATVQKIENKIQNLPDMEVVQTNRRGKISQINYFLPKIKTDLIVNTDVDGRLEENVLIEMVKEFQSDSKTGAVGGLVTPQNCCPEETQYWKAQNQTRVLESKAFSSSTVVAVCYGFRNGLIKSFPEDVVADDIYLPFEANVNGYRAIYSPRVVCFEIRAPNSTSDLIRHKFRKANAYITEVLRFICHLPRLNLFWKIIFMTRALQILGLSWFLLIFSLLTISLISFGVYEIIFWCLGVSLVSLWIGHKVIASVKLPETQASDNIFLSLKVFLIMTFLLVCAGLTYPFYKQTSSYEKLE